MIASLAEVGIVARATLTLTLTLTLSLSLTLTRYIGSRLRKLVLLLERVEGLTVTWLGLGLGLGVRG